MDQSPKVDIVYYTDPLCCWSWAMEAPLTRLKKEYAGKIRWRNCMGGLIPDWKHFRDEVNHVSRPAQMGPIWMEAAHTTGTAINSTIWIEDPPTSSYLSCIAVKSAGLQSPAAEEQYLHQLRAAVMAGGINISYETTLVRLARALSAEQPELLDIQLFCDDLRNGRGSEAFKKDLQEVQQLQIHRFPTLLMKNPGRASLLITGFRPYEVLAATVEKMLAGP